MKNLLIPCSLIILLLLTGANLLAESDVIYASYQYTMGDNDSKIDARNICFIEVKRRILEKAGVYIESESEVKNFKLTKDEIKTYAAALLKIQTIEEQIKVEGNSVAIYMKAIAEVDRNEIMKGINNIVKDKSLQQKVKEQQKHLQELEKKIETLQKELSLSHGDKIVKLRKERNIVFEEIDKLNEIKIKVLSIIENKTDRALTYVQSGMTESEVIKLAGEYRNKVTCSGRTYLNYGNIWIYFEDGIVKGYIKNTKWRGKCAPYFTGDYEEF